MRYIVCILIFFTELIFAQEKAKDVWQFKKEQDGIKVYTKDLETTSIKELKAVFMVKTSLASIVSLLNDSEAFPQWAYRCGSCTTLTKISESEFIRYQTVMAPWPVVNRDFVVKIKVTQDPKTKVVVQTVSYYDNGLADKEDYVRIKTFRGVWTLTPLKDGLVNIEYQLLVDPGGSIPVWLINLTAVDGPIENSKAMKIWLKKEKYAKAKLSFVKEQE